MLSSISIRNYAIIATADISFLPQLNAIIGETGAGKSILMGALGLALGKRADSHVLMDKDQKCVIEAHLEIAPYHLSSYFEAHDLDYHDSTIIRREITPNGKSRAFINDLPVTLETLRGLTAQLIDIHAQQETRDLEDDTFFIRVLDKLAGNESLLKEYQSTYKRYKTLQSEIARFKENAAQFAKEYDFVKFQFDELQQIPLSEELWSEMEDEIGLLQNAEAIQSGLGNVHEILENAPMNISDLLSEAGKTLQSIASFHPDIAHAKDLLEDIRLQLRETDRQLQHLQSNTMGDESRLQELSEIQTSVNRLMQKHHLGSMKELIDLYRSLEEKLASFSFSDEKVAALEAELKVCREQLIQDADKIQQNRRSASEPFARDITALLKDMGMPYATVSFDFVELSEPDRNGMDSVTFLFAPNKGSQLKSLDEVGSGGERSRLMLAIKSLIARQMALPTLIFDEIDTGISGEVAKKVGELLKQIAHHHQVITITHLPQIAASAGKHFLVYKNHESAQSVTHIEALDRNSAVTEIAKMLSGDNPSAAAMENARLLMEG